MGDKTFYATISGELVKKLFPEGHVTIEDLRDVDEMGDDAYVTLAAKDKMRFGCKDGKIVDVSAAQQPAAPNPPIM